MICYHVAVVAGVLLLAAIPSDVPGAVTLVATILLLATLSSKVTEPVALVALAATTSSSHASVISSATSTITITTISLRTLSGKVAYSVTSDNNKLYFLPPKTLMNNNFTCSRQNLQILHLPQGILLRSVQS